MVRRALVFITDVLSGGVLVIRLTSKCRIDALLEDDFGRLMSSSLSKVRFHAPVN